MTSTDLNAISSILIVFGILAIVLAIFLLVAGWKIFKKAGEPGWKILIPIYNIYTMFKILGMTNWFWATLATSLCSDIAINLNAMASDGTNTANSGSFAIMMIVVIIDLVVTIWGSILYSIRLSKSFGHGGGYAVGIFFLPYIFWMILGFGSSEYKKIDFDKAKNNKK